MDTFFLFSLPTVVVSKTAPVESFHTWFSSLLLLILAINLKMIEAYCSSLFSWRWQYTVWWAENQEFLLPAFCLPPCSHARTSLRAVCTFLQKQAGMWTHGLSYSKLLLGQWETLPGELGLVQVRETLACYTGQHLNYFSCLHVLSLISVKLINLLNLHFFISSYFSIFLSWNSATSPLQNLGHRWVYLSLIHI